jgi:hypothetical protein
MMKRDSRKSRPVAATRFINATLDAALLIRLDKWRERQAFPPTQRATLEAAIREFLDTREKHS